MTLINDARFPGLQYITANNIHSPKVSAIFSTRNGGVSGQMPETEYLRSMNLSLRFSTEAGSLKSESLRDSNSKLPAHATREEDYGNIEENYRIIMSSQGVEFKSLVALKQGHTSNIVVVDKDVVESNRSNPFGFNKIFETADALVTNIRGLLLSVRTADCVPILLYDSKNQSIGAVHSGWRGTLAGIGLKTVKRMSDVYGTDPKDIKAAIGPAIGQCCFEVGFDVKEKFVVEYGDDITKFFIVKPNGKPHGDIKSMNKALLIEAGILEENIEVSDLCTKCNPDLFYSARYSKGKFGLMANFIGLK